MRHCERAYCGRFYSLRSNDAADIVNFDVRPWFEKMALTQHLPHHAHKVWKR